MELVFSGLNLWAVIVGAAATMITGMLWYSPGSPTGKAWFSLNKFPEQGENKDNLGAMYGMMFFSSLVLSFFLGVIVKTLNITEISSGLMTMFWIWVGFIAASCAGQYIFPPKPFALFALDNIYKLVNVLIITAILIVWS